MNAAPRAVRGPNGLIELKQMNGVQGWHSGYLTPDQARELSGTLRELADETENPGQSSPVGSKEN